MAVSLGSVVAFSSANLQAQNRHGSTSTIRARPSQPIEMRYALSMIGLRKPVKEYRWGVCFSVRDSNQLAAESNNKGSENAEKSFSDNQSSALIPQSLDSLSVNSIGEKSMQSETSSVSSESQISSDVKQESFPAHNSQSIPKRSPLTARERLRAARVLSRYTESKASKSEMGSKVLDALKGSDPGKKRSGLPEAPTNLFDDSKRGLPKQGLTFQFPGGVDLFFIAISFVLISTVMFTTTYIVWKVGAIHFNEY